MATVGVKGLNIQ